MYACFCLLGCALHACSACGSQKRALDLLALQLQTGASLHVVLGTKTGSSARGVSETSEGALLLFYYLKLRELGVMVHTFSPSTGETEAGGAL